jgi:hypothetical protein
MAFARRAAGPLTRAVHEYNALVSARIRPPLDLIKEVSTLCLERRNLRVANSLLHSLKYLNIAPPEEVYTASQDLGYNGVELYKFRRRLGLRIDLKYYNHILKQLAKPKRELTDFGENERRYRAMWAFYARLRKEGIQPDEETFSHLLAPHVENGDMEAVNYIASYAIKPTDTLNIPPLRHNRAVAKKQKEVRDDSLSGSLELDEQITALQSAKWPDDDEVMNMALFEDICKAQVTPAMVGVNTFPSVISSSDLVNLHTTLQLDPHHPIATNGSRMLSHYIKCLLAQNSSNAYTIFEALRKNGKWKELFPSLIEGLCVNGRLTEAESLLEQDLYDGDVGVDTWEHLIAAIVSKRGVEKGMEV